MDNNIVFPRILMIVLLVHSYFLMLLPFYFIFGGITINELLIHNYVISLTSFIGYLFLKLAIHFFI